MSNDPSGTIENSPTKSASVRLTYDRSINFAFQQNAIPVVREIQFENDAISRKDLLVRISTEPAFAQPAELRLQAIAADEVYRASAIDLKLSPDFLSAIDERVAGWLKVEVLHAGDPLCSVTEPVALLARNEWCGLVSLPEILAAFILPNDPAVMNVLGRASELLREHTGRGALSGYQDKSRMRAWEQVAAIYRAIGELAIRYIVPPASFEKSGQKVRLPSDVFEQRFATCLDLALLFAACCEQAGLHPLVLIHDGHAYGGCWLEERTLPESCSDDLQHIRKLVAEELITVFECTLLASEAPGTLMDAEREARPHLHTKHPFRLLLDVHRARIARIHPLPIPGAAAISAGSPERVAPLPDGIGQRTFTEVLDQPTSAPVTAATRIDHWKSRLLDLSLRNRLLNFRETKATVQVLSADPERVEDYLAADAELALQPRPRLMSDRDPRSAATYEKQQRVDAIAVHLREELGHQRLHTNLEETEHSRRLTELFRAARTAIDENGTNTMFAAVGILEWRETEHSERVLRAPLLLVPVQLRRKSVVEGFSLRRLDEETRLNVTLMEMLRQHFQKTVAGLEPLPEDESGVDVPKVFRIFRDAVRDLTGWEVKEEIWLGQFSFTKFLLWNDLTTRLDQLIKNPVVDHLANRAGIPYVNRGDDIRATELDRLFQPRQVFCPRSADSSQLAAVMAAAAGQDFILEGPPGTGKSQTITNIIAHCLAEGKRVLFVAEKRAALDVVFRRLREDGLEPFCLELHSNKTGKGEVLAQFERTLKFASRGTPSEWEQRAAELGRLRDSLNEYALALHERHSCGLSAYQCLDYLVPRQDDPTVSFVEWPNILETTAEMLERARELSRLMQERTRGLVPLAEHGLAPLACEEWTPAWAERALNQVREYTVAVEHAIEATRDLRGWLRSPDAPVSRTGLQDLQALVESLLDPRPVGAAFARTPWSELGAQLEQWAAVVAERSDLRQRLSEVLEPLGEGVQAVRVEVWSSVEAERTQRESEELRRLATQLIERADEMRAWLNAPRTYQSRSQLAYLDGLAESLVDTPADLGAPFATARWDRTRSDLTRWIDLVRERAALRGSLASYDEAHLLTLDLESIHKLWRAANATWFLPKWLKTRRVRRELRPARLDGKAPLPKELTADLQAARRLQAIQEELRGASDLASAMLGPTWRKGEPDAGELAQVLAWGGELQERIERATAQQAEWAEQLRARIGQILTQGRSALLASSGSVPLAPYRAAFAAYNQAYEPTVDAAGLRRTVFDSAPDHLGGVRSSLTVFLGTAPRIRACNVNLASNQDAAQACLGALWKGGEPSAEMILDARAWGQAFHARLLAVACNDLGWLGEMRELIASLFAAGPAAYAPTTSTGGRFHRFREAQLRFEAAFGSLSEQLRIRRAGLEAAPDHLGAAISMARRIESAWPSIRDWCSWQRARREAVDLGLTRLVEKLEAKEGAGSSVPALFERSFRRAFLFAALEREAPLREFFGREHNERIAQFREVDAKLSELTTALVQARLAAVIPRDSAKENQPTTELGLLRKEIGKKARHIPVRQLLSRLPKLLPRLKPCVLMSPLSVAQYLDASQDQFDLVVFDEASQIPVWDAIGAIARGRQLIVVGDPKQLPPTNFFNTSDDDDDDLMPAEQKDLESILDELLSNGVRHKRLQWHYRSRHEGLITFSNRLYYENDLLTFPSPTTQHAGVRFMHLPGATYDKGKSRTNRMEAEALVKELVARLRKTEGPARSYGVVTFSQAQQTLVENLLDEERRKYADIEHHFGDDPPIEGEPVFVKNLENVQGDERDVILFSICYGPDETGRVSMNFGPLNRDGGERRLNVAVTRAKHEVLVFSGLRAEQIDLTRTRAKGVRDLKYFLDYADRGPRALAAATSLSGAATAESEFEHLVANRIRAAGFEVHHQVGCSGYRIDLAVVDPTAPGRYLLGVECDGATYHRAATARDRDKLRQAVLEGLGWEVHRIWSTDWWHDAKGETEKLLVRLTEMVDTHSSSLRPD